MGAHLVGDVIRVRPNVNFQAGKLGPAVQNRSLSARSTATIAQLRRREERRSIRWTGRLWKRGDSFRSCR